MVSKQQPGTHLAPEQMAAMTDGNLDSEERDALVQHLAECEECRDLLAAYARAQSGVERGWPARVSRSTTTWMSLAAALAVAVTAGVLMSRRSPSVLEPLPGNATILAPPSIDSAPSSLPPPGTPPADDLSIRRSGTRQVGTKTFRLEAGVWIDTTYDPLALLPTEDFTGANREEVLAGAPWLQPYLVLGPRFVVVHGGTVYRFGPR